MSTVARSAKVDGRLGGSRTRLGSNRRFHSQQSPGSGKFFRAIRCGIHLAHPLGNGCEAVRVRAPNDPPAAALRHGSHVRCCLAPGRSQCRPLQPHGPPPTVAPRRCRRICGCGTCSRVRTLLETRIGCRIRETTLPTVACFECAGAAHRFQREVISAIRGWWPRVAAGRYREARARLPRRSARARSRA